eukprot:10841-Heterococcus_DN1.PRE.1
MILSHACTAAGAGRRSCECGERRHTAECAHLSYYNKDVQACLRTSSTCWRDAHMHYILEAYSVHIAANLRATA